MLDVSYDRCGRELQVNGVDCSRSWYPNVVIFIGKPSNFALNIANKYFGFSEIYVVCRGDAFELHSKGVVPYRCAIPLTDPRPAATACRSRRGEAPEGSSFFRPGVEARSAEDPGKEDLERDIRPC